MSKVTWICACGEIQRPPITKCIICLRESTDNDEERQEKTEKFQRLLREREGDR